MRLCAVSFKECWQDEHGRWMSDGGFPLQMAALGSLFERMTLVTVVGPARSGGIALPENLDVVAVAKPAGDGWRRKLDVMRSSPGLVRTLRRAFHDTDVIHTPLPGDIPFVGMLVALLERKRIIARYGGSWRSTAQTTLANRITRQVMRLAGGGLNVMLATGDPVEIDDRRVHAIFSTALSAKELAALEVDFDRGLSEPPQAIYAGRLSSEKGVKVLIEALALLGGKGDAPNLRLTIAGDGPQREELEATAEAVGVAEAVRFTGQLDRTALSREMRRCDFSVQPSLTEGFSKAWLDALAHGLPVVASDVGAAGKVVGRAGERGWLVPPGDANALAGVIRQVLAGGFDWRTLRERCRAYVEGRTLEAWAAAIGGICARQWGLRLVGGRLVA